MNVDVTVATAGQETFVESFKVWIEIVQGATTVAAVLIAGIWSYLLFGRQRQRFPRAEISHRAMCVELAPTMLLLRVTVVVKNVGTVLIRLLDGHVQVQRLRPVPTKIKRLISKRAPVRKGCSEADWPVVGKRECQWQKAPREVEPSELDEFHFDFFVDPRVQTVEIYSYFRNAIKHGREIGWNHTTIVELSKIRVDRAKNRRKRLMGKASAGGKGVGSKGVGGKGDAKSPGSQSVKAPREYQGPPKNQSPPKGHGTKKPGTKS